MDRLPWFQYPHNRWKNKHAVIIGGGIAGCQMAWHLSQKNWSVTIIERHSKLAKEASGNPAGVISPKMTARPSIGESFYTQSFHYTTSLLKILGEQGLTIDWQACGVIQLAHNEREIKRWKALKTRQLSAELIHCLDAEETLNTLGLKGVCRPKYKSYFFPKGGWINPASYAEALTQNTRCRIHTHRQAISLQKAGSMWQVLDHNKTIIEQSEVVIIANGKDLFQFEQASFLPGLPVAGQTTRASASPHSSRLKRVVGHEGYLTPAIHGHHILGATFERDVHDPPITRAADKQNMAQLARHLPQLTASISHYTSAHVAVRMTTPDRFPYVGGLPDQHDYQNVYKDLYLGKHWKNYPAANYQEGVFVLGGFGSRGLTTSAYCAKILADLLENSLNSEEEKQVLQYCHPGRFLIKNLKRQIT